MALLYEDICPACRKTSPNPNAPLPKPGGSPPWRVQTIVMCEECEQKEKEKEREKEREREREKERKRKEKGLSY